MVNQEFLDDMYDFLYKAKFQLASIEAEHEKPRIAPESPEAEARQDCRRAMERSLAERDIEIGKQFIDVYFKTHNK